MTWNETQVREGLLALNTDEVPYRFAEFTEGVVGVWDYADAKWASFAAAGTIDKSYSLTVTLDPDEKTYDLLDRTKDVETRLDRKGFHFEANTFQGTTRKISFNKTITPIAKDQGQVGHTYGWKFDTEEMKAPVRELMEKAGWTPKKKSLFAKMLGR